MTRSVFNGNPHGIEGDSGAQITVDGSTISGASTAVESNFSVRLSNSDVAFNVNGAKGTVATFGNNRFTANGTDGTLTAVGGASSNLGEH